VRITLREYKRDLDEGRVTPPNTTRSSPTFSDEIRVPVPAAED
jgi:hypothetical protein